MFMIVGVCREEHRAHSAGCLFLKLKNPKEMTIAELLKLEAAAQVNLMVSVSQSLMSGTDMSLLISVIV